MGTGTLRLFVLGLAGEALEVDKSVFETQAAKLGALFVESPPPFAAACKDGLIFIFNIVMGPMDVRGASITLDEAMLEEPANSTYRGVWTRANKPMTVSEAKVHFKFPAQEEQ